MAFSKRTCDVLTIALFLSSLYLPMVNEWSAPAAVRMQAPEFRELARPPLLPDKSVLCSKRGLKYLQSDEGRAWLFSKRGLRWLLRYPQRYQEFHSDSFGYRDVLLESHCAMAWHVFGSSAAPIMLRGKNKWIFTDEASEQAVWRGGLPFTEAELDAWARSLRSRREYFAKRGIEYYMCIAPDKANVYPEHMPAWATRGETRLDQLQTYLGDEDVGLISLRDAVVAEKVRDQGEDLTYRRLGSHWTDRGAKAASELIAARLRERWPDLPMQPRSLFDYGLGELALRDDMGARLRVGDEELGERLEFTLRPRGKKNWHTLSQVNRGMRTRGHLAGAPKGWIQHDSFGEQIRSFLFSYLGDSESAWAYDLNLERALANEAEVVLEVVVERSLNFRPPALQYDLDGTELADKFAGSSETLMSLPAGEPWGGISPNGRLRLRVKERGLAIARVRQGGGLWLPPVESPENRDLVFRFEITVAEADEVRLVYSTKSRPEFDSRTSFAQKLEPGRNEIFFELLAPELTGRIFVIPFAKTSDALLHSVEVRAVAH